VTANALHWNLAEKKKETEPLRVRPDPAPLSPAPLMMNPAIAANELC
jgi:hypothetical protein